MWPSNTLLMLSSNLALISLQCLLHMTSFQSAKITPTPLPRALSPAEGFCYEAPLRQLLGANKLAERQCSASRNRRQAEAEEGNVNDSGNNKHVNGRVRVHVWRILGMGDGGDCNATTTMTSRRADCILPHGLRRCRSWQ